MTEIQEEKSGRILTPKQNYVNYRKVAEGFEEVRSHVPESPEEDQEVLKECLESERVDIVVIPIEEKISFDLWKSKDLHRLD